MKKLAIWFKAGHIGVGLLARDLETRRVGRATMAERITEIFECRSGRDSEVRGERRV